MTRTVWVLGLLAVLLLASPGRAAEEMTAREKAQIDRMIHNFKPVRDRTGVRDLFAFALSALEYDYRTELIEEAFDVAEKMQDRDPESRTYGNFRWYWHNERPQDRNAVEFSMERGILIWMFHRDKLTPKAREQLERLIRLSVEGIRRHNVPDSYTNIFVMKTWNCIAIGENFGMPDLAEEGYRLFDAWFHYTWLAGIHEYLSPTYYGVDMPSLGLIANNAKRQRERDLAKAALKLFWTDAALNWFEPSQRLGGAHSRDYDYVTGHGLADQVLNFNGFDLAREHSFGVHTPFFTYGAAPEPEGIRDLVAKKPRFVRQSWGAAPYENAAHYVGKTFSIGSAGANYGPMDKILVVNLPGGYKEPVVSYLMDGRGDPYGQARFSMGSSGHNKALHVQPFVTRVQRGPEVLMVSSIHPGDRMFQARAPEATCLLTHLVMPSVVTMYVGAEGDPVECVDRMQVGREPFFIRKHGAVLGVRILLGTSEKGAEAPVELVMDGEGHEAMRLTVKHAEGEPKERATTVMWVRAAEGLDDAGVARFRKAFCAARGEARIAGERIEASAEGLEGALRLVAEPEAVRRLVREGEEEGADKLLLGVDGRDLGREILENLEPVKEYRKMLARMDEGEGVVARAGEVFEAEAGRFMPPFEVRQAPGASGGKFVLVPNEKKKGGGVGAARLMWDVAIPRDGTYYLAARLLTPTPEDDSFFVSVEQKRVPVVERYAWHTGAHEKFEWAPLEQDRGSAMPLDLKKGVARITFRCREDGAGVDSLILTADKTWKP